MKVIETYRAEFLKYLNTTIKVKEPVNLYQPIHYILQLGGKRLRPVLTLAACDLFDGSIEKAFDAALAVEVFHNFTLIHDDIMDSAPVRRGKETVHSKWDLNTGILSGDAMLIMAYHCFENYDGLIFKKLFQLLNKTAIEVCEGQQLDVDFETRNDVTIEEYIKMITYKTSVLVAAAMKMGAIIANANSKDADSIYEFGLNLGIAFQLQDDYLDTFGNSETFGKRIGGDIAENKKTYLFLKAIEVADFSTKEKLVKYYNSNGHVSNKIEKVTELFTEINVQEITQNEIKLYTNKAFDVLDKLSLSESKKNFLIEFGLSLMNRTI